MKYDVVSIVDSIGTMQVPLKLGNKLTPYFFATKKELLMKYLDIDWGSHMPHSETLGLLTEAMVNDGVRIDELEDDKSNILFDGTQDGEKGKDLGRYHIRAGSTPAYLLATKKYGDIKTYEDYLKNQPRSEFLRQLAWYQYIIENSKPSREEGIQLFLGIWRFLTESLEILTDDWDKYFNKFKEYHGLG